MADRNDAGSSPEHTGNGTLSVYDRMARDYQRLDRGAEPTGYAAFTAALAAGARVLDLGCGPGTAAARLAADGHNVLAVDGSAEMVALAGARPGVTARLASFDDVPALGRFGGVWATFSLLHAPRRDLSRHLQDIRAALLPGGAFLLGMKTGTGAGTDRLGRFYTYYSEAELHDHLSAAGFAPQEVWHGTDTGLAGTEDPWILILSKV